MKTKDQYQFFQDIFNSQLHAMLVLEPVRLGNTITDFTIVAINDRMARLLCARMPVLVGQRLRELFPAIASDSLMDQLIKIVEEDAHIQFEHCYKTGGKQRWLELSGVKLDEGIALTGKDVTEKKSAEQRLRRHMNQLIRAHVNKLLEQHVQERTLELQRANIQLANSNDELQQFASIASHDLKEPLRKIYMFSNLLKENHLHENTAALQYLDRIIRSSERMMQLVNDLLSFSHLAAEGTYQMVDLNDILNEVLADLELCIQEKKATLEMDELPVAEVVPGQMRQVFQNILGNALKFSRPSVPAFISISADRVLAPDANSPVDEHGPYCRISIRDNGIGFDEAFLPKIFTIFQRLHSRKEYDGTGIGLAICKKIVEKHGGIITAKSRENEGATFIIVIPLRQNRDRQLNGTLKAD